MKKELFTLSFLPIICFGSHLKIYDDKESAILYESSDEKQIQSTLEEFGIRYEKCQVSYPIEAFASLEDVAILYKEDIARIQEEENLASFDIARIDKTHPQKEALRHKFLMEHTHDEPEVRFFVEGGGLFFLHTCGKVLAVQCEEKDLISIPENMPHWFDMGKSPSFTAIRFFTKKEGWIAYPTGSPISYEYIKE